MRVEFSPPDMSDNEIERVTEVLRSGWITTGPVTKQFENDISRYCGTKRTACLSSATAAMELSLRVLGIGPGDEVITSAYTYSASAAVIAHTGAEIVLADTYPGGVSIDPASIEKKITERTKAIIPVDIAGIPADYEVIHKVIESKKNIFNPNNEMQRNLGRIAIVADSAHSFGAVYKGKNIANSSDFCCFSFHAVKNLTTAEGGCVTFSDVAGVSSDELYNRFMLLSLHGQDKDALAKTVGSWEYDIKVLGYKYNMPDILAAFGASQLQRYDEMLEKRHNLVDIYNNRFLGSRVKPLLHVTDSYRGSFHVYVVRIEGFDEDKRNKLFIEMAKRGVSLNVHFKPLPLHTAYINLGFNIKDYPNAYDYYKAEITLPLYSIMTVEQVEYVASQLLEVLKQEEFQSAG